MKAKIIALSLIIALCGLCVTGCGHKASSDDKVIANVSNRKITTREFRSKIAKLPAYYQTVIDKNKNRYLDEIIMEMLLYEEGVRKGVDKDKEVREVLDEAKKKIVIAKYIKNEVEDKALVTDDEMKKFYDEHKDELKTPQLWRASHILVADEKQARDIRDELARGESFEKLAGVYSIDATAARGGDVGYFREGQLVPEFEKACLKLNVGQTSDIIHTQFGYHIIRLTDKKEPSVENYDNENVKRVVEGELKKTKRAKLFDDLVARLKKKYNVNIQYDVFESLGKTDKAAETVNK